MEISGNTAFYAGLSSIQTGQNRVDQSFARIEVSADSHETLDDLILRLRQHGAEVVEQKDAQLAAAPADGVFPTDFYVTTNQQTFVRIGGKVKKWLGMAG